MDALWFYAAAAESGSNAPTVFGIIVLAGAVWGLRLWWEFSLGVKRCGARVGLLGKCDTPVDDRRTRCSAHTGRPVKFFV